MGRSIGAPPRQTRHGKDGKTQSNQEPQFIEPPVSVALIQGQTHSPHRAFFFPQECPLWACQDRATLKAHQKSVSPHVSAFVEQFERSFGTIRPRPVSGLLLDQWSPTLESGNDPGVWKPPWSLENTLQKRRADSSMTD